MPRSNRILAIDIGAASIKVAEFDFKQDQPVLCGYDHREYDEELNDESRRFLIAGLLRQILVENSFQARKAVVGVSGQSALTRFVKLPPVADEEHRVRQIVEFEAQQNVPFSMDEVLWDYQLIGTGDEDELEVMFVVIKNEIVTQITNAVCGLGLELQLVDVAPVASYNAARANHIGDDECAMVLNIGARSTNLLFADRERFFCRTIPIAGHTITQQIAKEFQINFEEAEELKRRHGFVALGGAYEEPESEVATAVSKIVRTVMARLHGEINRSINVYRSQHKGKRPTALYLTGGSSIMAYTDQFFAEKLRMNVSYLNPFGIVSLAENVDSGNLQEKAHMFSEVIGLALRYRVQCPVEISLVPKSIRREQDFNKRKPYLAAAMVAALLIPLVSWLVNRAKADLYSLTYDKLQTQLQTLDDNNKEIKREQSRTQELVEEYQQVAELLEKRKIWPSMFQQLEKIRPEDVWFDAIEPVRKSGEDEESDRTDRRQSAGPSYDFLSRPPEKSDSERKSSPKDTAVYEALHIHGNAIQIKGIDPSHAENNDQDSSETEESRQAVELELLRALRQSPLFKEDADATKIIRYEPPETFLNFSRFVIRAEFETPQDMRTKK